MVASVRRSKIIKHLAKHGEICQQRANEASVNRNLPHQPIAAILEGCQRVHGFGGFDEHKVFRCSKHFSEVPYQIVKESVHGYRVKLVKDQFGHLMAFHNRVISSRVLLYSRLGPILFNISTDDVEKEVYGEISNSADGTKLCQIEAVSWRRHPKGPYKNKEAKIWQVSFSVGKFKRIYLRKNYLGNLYMTLNSKPASTSQKIHL